MDFELKYTNAVDANRAMMFLYSHIGQPQDPKIQDWIRAQYFADEIYYHARNGREICVYINSVGGRIYDGMVILQAVLDSEANTHIVGMAASMAGIIALGGKERTMNDFAIGMAHPPQGKADKVLEMARAQMRVLLTENTKLSAKQIDKITEDGAEPHWMDSSEMLKAGFVDKIVKTGKKKQVADRVNFEKMNTGGLKIPETFEIYTDIVNSLTNTNPKKPREMDVKIIAGLLGLTNDAEESTIANKLAEFKNSAAVATADKAKITDLEAKLADITGKYNALETLQRTNGELLVASARERATDLVNAAIVAGRITEDSKADMIELATTNFALAKKTIDAVKVSPAHNSVHNVLGGLPAGAAAQNAETYENLAKTNPDKLNKMFVENRAEFDRLAKEHEERKNGVLATI